METRDAGTRESHLPAFVNIHSGCVWKALWQHQAAPATGLRLDYIQLLVYEDVVVFSVKKIGHRDERLPHERVSLVVRRHHLAFRDVPISKLRVRTGDHQILAPLRVVRQLESDIDSLVTAEGQLPGDSDPGTMLASQRGAHVTPSRRKSSCSFRTSRAVPSLLGEI